MILTEIYKDIFGNGIPDYFMLIVMASEIFGGVEKTGVQSEQVFQFKYILLFLILIGDV
jgi:hypothetical protein